VPDETGPAAASFDTAARTPAQRRIMAAALELFAEHGVGGTSLQMIADAVGVTKAAVYHRFQAKDEIVIAVTEAELGRLEEALLAAEVETNRPQARKLLLDRVIDLTVARRRLVATMTFDPVIV
jgi:AcrR family transcriptional regulator